jgi:O-antigen ligase
MYWLLYQLVDSRDVARRVIALCMLSAVGEAFLAVYERLQGIGRATAHLDEPNRAGAFFAGTAVFFFAFVLMEKGRQRWPFLIAWVLTMTALFATLSRGGMLAAGLGSMVIFAIFLLFSEQKGLATKFNYMVLGILVAGNIALILPERVMDRLLVTVQGDPRETDVKEGDIFDLPAGSIDPEKMDDSAADRLLLWTVGLRLYREQPSGYGSFTATPLQAKYRGSPKAMHNIYLQVLVEHGIQGLACLVLLILTVARNLWKSFRKATAIEESTVLLGLLGYWVALCVAHFFVNPFFMLHLTGQFWIMSACALRACSEKEPVPSRMNDVKFAARGVAGRLQRDTTAWR